MSMSPVTRAAELKKPTFIIHPGKDARVPVEPGAELMKAMQGQQGDRLVSRVPGGESRQPADTIGGRLHDRVVDVVLQELRSELSSSRAAIHALRAEQQHRSPGAVAAITSLQRGLEFRLEDVVLTARRNRLERRITLICLHAIVWSRHIV